MRDWWLASYIILWVLSAATLVVLLVVLRQLGLIYLRVGRGVRLEEGPPVGAIIPPFDEVEDETGSELRFPSESAELTLLLLTSPHCSICEEALQNLREVTEGLGVDSVVVSDGAIEENRRLREIVGRSAKFVTSGRRQMILAVETIPFGIAVDKKGVVLEKGTVNSPDDIAGLLERAASAQTVAMSAAEKG